jgi:RDD family.
VAYIVDAAIVGLVGSVVAIALGFGERTVTATSTYVWVSGTTLNVSFALLGLIYFVFFWTGGRRATIGQRIFDIQVGNAFDGRPLSLDQALARWVGYGSFLGLFAIVPTLGSFASLAELIWVLVLLATTARSPTKQGLHDRFANTALVRPSSRASSGPAMACLIIVVLLGVLFAMAVAALIFLGSQVGPLLQPPGTTI